MSRPSPGQIITYDEAESSHDHGEATSVLLAQHHAQERSKCASKEQRTGEELQNLVVELQIQTDTTRRLGAIISDAKQAVWFVQGFGSKRMLL
jgi:hypothetical protein